jgi:hypothetical protein
MEFRAFRHISYCGYCFVLTVLYLVKEFNPPSRSASADGKARSSSPTPGSEKDLGFALRFNTIYCF